MKNSGLAVISVSLHEKNAILGILRELQFDEVYTLEIAFLQFFCIMEVCGGGACLWLYPEHRAEAKQDLQLLNAQRMGAHEAEIEKIKSVFLAPLSLDDVTAMIAGQIGRVAPMDEEVADLFQRLAKKMIEQAGNGT